VHEQVERVAAKKEKTHVHEFRPDDGYRPEYAPTARRFNAERAATQEAAAESRREMPAG